MTKTTTAAAIASTIVHAKSPQSGPPYAGRSNGLSAQALVLSPVQSPMPVKTREPSPAAIRPGSSTSESAGPPPLKAAASSRITAPITGEPNTVEMAAKLPAAAISPNTCWGASFRTSRTAMDRETHAKRDQRSFRAKHEPETECGERRQENAWELDRLCGAFADLETAQRARHPVSPDGVRRVLSRHMPGRSPRSRRGRSPRPLRGTPAPALRPAPVSPFGCEKRELCLRHIGRLDGADDQSARLRSNRVPVRT